MCDVISEITEGLLIRIQEYWKLNSLGLKETDNNNQSIIMSELIHTYIKSFFLILPLTLLWLIYLSLSQK
jgi:hypothetical protein